MNGYFVGLVGAVILAGVALTFGEETAGTSAANPVVQKISERVVQLDNYKDLRAELKPERVRRVRVFLPEGYAQSAQKYPVIYLNDGSASAAVEGGKSGPDNGYFNYVHDHLVRQGLINPAIIVAVDPSTVGRDYEYRPKWQGPDAKGFFTNSGGIEEYYGFLTQQLKPYIDQQFRTKTDAANTGIVGCSYGGLAATYLGYQHPETFGMAGVIAGSLWWDDMALVKEMDQDKKPKTNTRFWFQVGLREDDSMWEPAMRAARSLTKRGYVDGKDVALYIDYTGVHSYHSWVADVSHMFRFFLSKTPPELQQISLKNYDNYLDTAFVLDRIRDLPLVTVELNYDHGYRANAIDPQLASSDPKVFTVDHSRFETLNNTLVNQGNGVALLQGKFGKLSAEQVVVGHVPDLPAAKERYECLAVEKALNIMDPLAQWPELKYQLDLMQPGPTTQPGQPDKSCKFGLWHDDKTVYIAVQVKKPQLVVRMDAVPWFQDGIEIRLDARPDPLRSNGKGEGEMKSILLFGISPNPKNDKAPLVFDPEELPGGVTYSCKVNPEGYTLQLAIKNEYLDTQQKDSWKEFRFNLDVNTQDDIKAPCYKHWWQPDWRSQESIPASGTFIRGKLKQIESSPPK